MQEKTISFRIAIRRVTIRVDVAKAGWKQPRVQIVGGDGKITDRRDMPGSMSFRVEGETMLLIDGEPTVSAIKKKTS